MSIFNTDECVICLDHEPQVTFAPCRHKCSCDQCGTLIIQRTMPCPMCRGDITGRLQEEKHVPALQYELDRFEKDREEYLKKLNRPCAKNAGFTGGNKLARSVAREMGDELEQRRLETAGSERMMNAKKAVFLEDKEEGILIIDYKVGRRKLQETAPLIYEWDEVCTNLKDLLDGDVISEMDLVTYYPEVFWLCKWHKKSLSKDLIQNISRKRAKQE